MPSPFPGMDPYLEQPDLWPEVHSRLLVAIADDLGPQLRPQYRVAIEKRVYDVVDQLAIGRPDATIIQSQAPEQLTTITSASTAVIEPIMVELPMSQRIQERYLEIREPGTGQVVTIVELISPSNKRSGKGRQQYEEKRLKILASDTHLVEIDLIRAFQPLPLRGSGLTSLYRILVSRAEQRPHAALYPFNLQESIPNFPIPLHANEPEVFVGLQQLLNQVYERASYDLAIDYSLPPVPPLTSENAAWAKTLIHT